MSISSQPKMGPAFSVAASSASRVTRCCCCCCRGGFSTTKQLQPKRLSMSCIGRAVGLLQQQLTSTQTGYCLLQRSGVSAAAAAAAAAAGSRLLLPDAAAPGALAEALEGAAAAADGFCSCSSANRKSMLLLGGSCPGLSLLPKAAGRDSSSK